MIFLKILANFISALNAKATPRGIAGGFALGAIIGLTPTGSLHNIAVLLLIFILPLNKSASLVSAILFGLFAYALDPLFDRIGYFLLTLPALKPMWTALYNTPVVPWTRFNNTVVLGSLVGALAVLPLLFWGAAWGVAKYRERVVAVVAKWKIAKIVKASKLFMLYEKLS
jgi:uncharacterized protein (TIGR03546 family)